MGSIRGFWAVAALAGSALLGGCAETVLAIHTTKQIKRATADQAVDKGIYKVGKPYQVNGVWYYPSVDYNYSETGIASWYGNEFHGRNTANGEIFDKNQLTAAHRTLPLPSLVRVTNLENGRALVLRVNDRGPFARGRIIDVSRRSAELLGFRGQGTSKVRVEILPEESLRLAVLAQSRTPDETIVTKMPAMPREQIAAEPLNGSAPRQLASASPARENWRIRPASGSVLESTWPEERRVDGHVTVEPVRDTRIFVQAGSFLKRENADRLRNQLSLVASAKIAPQQIGQQQFYRVRVGPLANVLDADYVLEKIVSKGHSDAKIVVE